MDGAHVFLSEDYELTSALSQSLDSCKDSTMGLFCAVWLDYLPWFHFLLFTSMSLCSEHLSIYSFQMHCVVKRDLS